MSDILSFKKIVCKNCYKCIRNCPVKSISFSQSQAQIVSDECVLCGKCVIACPQNAKDTISELKKVKSFIKSGKTVIASIDSAFIANFGGVGIETVKQALLSLGFADVEEAVVGADMVKWQYASLVKDKKQDIVITSCCHSINLLIQKHFPDCIKYLAGILSPMQAHCKQIKHKNPDAKCVYIGPCIAKKDEAAAYKDLTDAVLTFEELTSWIKESNVSFDHKQLNNTKIFSRYFSLSGGIIKNMPERSESYTYITVDGIENCIEALKEIQNGKIHNCFIEMNACKGGCIGGPEMDRINTSIIKSTVSLSCAADDINAPKNADTSLDLSKEFCRLEPKSSLPSQDEIKNILFSMGKTKPSDELNCGCCGYDTCREKAVAVYNGKSTVDDCLFLAKDLSESLLDHIIYENPNGVIVIDEFLKIRKINNAAKKLFNIREFSDVSGKQISDWMDISNFRQVLNTRNNIINQNTYLDNFDKYVDLTVIYNNDYNMLICFLCDLTQYTSFCERKNDAIVQTLEIADQVVQKQMMTVQEIASLLGETAAETKIALTKLKETLSNE